MTRYHAFEITLDDDIARMLSKLRRLPPWERAVVGGRLIAELRHCQRAISEVRKAAVWEMHDVGMSLSEIGEMIDVHPTRVSNLLHVKLGWRGGRKRVSAPVAK